MRKVVRQYFAYPVSYMREPVLRQPHVYHVYVELCCGHVKRDPWDVYSNETAVRVRAAVNALAAELGEPEDRKVRCYVCGKANAS